MIGNQTPTIHIAPEYSRTLGGAAYDFGASFGITLDPWQRLVMEDWLALDERGKWICPTCGLSVPRQNGKTALVKVRVMIGIFSFGETILFTCHEVRTSRQVFDSLADTLNPNGEYKDLANGVEYIKRSNGYEEIKIADWQDEDGEWHKGGKLLFSSRSKGASRGFTADVVVADEAMYMTDEQVSALVPTMASASGGDMQFIMLGTPPSPGDGGTVFSATRKSALEGAKGVSWCEWGVSEVGDVSDFSRVERTNPSIGTRLMWKAVDSEYAVMSPDCFARERLGWWSSVEESQRVITEAQWNACLVESRPSDGVDSLGIKYSADGSTVSVSVCRKDGDTHFVELLFNEPTSKGTAWLVDFIVERTKKYACAVIDGQYGAQSLMDRLDGQVPRNFIIRPKIADVISAHTTFKDYVGDGRIQHTGQPQLANSVTKSSKRAIGKDGGFGWKSNEAADASIVESAALAVHGSDKTKRNPNRKTGVAF